jgi:VanZ family protein
MRATHHSQRHARIVHGAMTAGLLIVASWGLLSAAPLAPLNGTPFRLLRMIDDFLIHLSVYGLVAVGVFSLFRESSRMIRNWWTGALIIHAVSTELLQSMIPERNCDPVDLIANLLGLMMGHGLVSLIPKFVLHDQRSERPNALRQPS